MTSLLQRYRRKISFALVGGSGVLLSYLILIVGVEVLGVPHQVAYLVQMVVVIEYNFVLNYYMTWGDRDLGMRTAWRLFHTLRIATILLNQLLFGAMVFAGVHYLIANTICVAAVSVLNYVAGDRMIFKNRATSTIDLTTFDNSELGPAPSVSIVVPVKHNSDTIRGTVLSLLDQDYAGPCEIILVGSHGDTTWRTIEDLINGKNVRAYELDVTSPGRDSNAKRSFGLEQASGDVLALVDSDMVMNTGWLNRVVEYLKEGYGAAAGPVRGLGNSFWTRYIDQNPIAPKTPRMRGVSVLNRKNVRWKKPPVTANFAYTRRVYETAGGPRTSFTSSYEDYELFGRVLDAGFQIVLDEALTGERYHREGFKPLLSEYFRSGRGCADYIVTRPACGFAQTRLLQLLATLLIAIAGLISLWRYPGLTSTVAVVGASALVLRSGLKVRRLEAAVYPLMTIVFAFTFVAGNISRFVKRGWAQTIAPTIHHSRQIILEEVSCTPLSTEQ